MGVRDHQSLRAECNMSPQIPSTRDITNLYPEEVNSGTAVIYPTADWSMAPLHGNKPLKFEF